MTRLRVVISRFVGLFRKRRLERDLDEDVRTHIEMLTEENLRKGMTPEDARYAALREFGGVEQIKEECRDSWTVRFINELAQDIRYGLRQLRRNPGFTAVAVLTLALGIGANTAVFSVLNAALIRPLTFPHPKRLVAATEFYPKFNHSMVLTPEYAAWKKQSNSFSQLGAYSLSIGMNLSGGPAANRVPAGHVTPNCFRVLEVHPILGRSFAPGEEKEHVAVLSYRLWQSYFASDSNILGKTATLNGVPYSVIGVMPPKFRDPESPDAEIWLPDAVPPSATHPGRSMGLVNVIGRLKPGVTVQQARADLEIIARRMDHLYPTPWSSYHAKATVQVVSLADALTSSARPELFVLAGAVAFILLIACANIANLLLARGVSREKEFAVRAALGASRARLVRSLLTECILLAVLGGLIGSALAVWGTWTLVFLLPAALGERVPLDSHVFIFALTCSVVTGVVFGLMPALAASRLDLNTNLKESGAPFGGVQRARRLRATLAVLQLALSVVLLVGAGLLIRSFVLLLGINPGFDTHDVLTAEVSLSPDLYDPPRQAAFFHQVLGRIRSLPGVTYAATVDAPPLGTFNTVASGLQPEGQPESDATVGVISISPDYFRALHIPLLRGRFFGEQDDTGAMPAAIVNQSLAHALFTNEDPLGHRIRMSEKGPWLTVVGEVADIRQRKLNDKLWPELYLPYLQSPASWMTLVVRTSSNPLLLASDVSKAVLQVDKAEPVFGVGTLDQRLSGSLAARREKMFLLGVFAAIALALAIVGLYGVMSYSVGQRTHEIGIRMALGAQKCDVLRMVVRQGLRLTLIGVAIGIAGALALTRFMSSLLYGVKPTDPVTFIAVSLLLTAVALLACYIPARRAAKVDPMVALRYE
jgi:putative ABC transport system permease protein